MVLFFFPTMMTTMNKTTRHRILVVCSAWWMIMIVAIIVFVTSEQAATITTIITAETTTPPATTTATTAATTTETETLQRSASAIPTSSTKQTTARRRTTEAGKSQQQQQQQQQQQPQTQKRQQQQRRPLQIYILAGQSNMVGKGAMEHMDMLVQSKKNDDIATNNTDTTYYRDTLWDADAATYRTRKDVYVRYGNVSGSLTLNDTSGFAYPKRFGPEVMFGWTIGDYYKNNIQYQKTDDMDDIDHDDMDEDDIVRPDVLLLKIAVGGKSLAYDFRPPSSGKFPIEKWGDNYGWLYRQLIDETKQTLHNLHDIVPQYDINADSYELKGFIWFQGWNDLVNVRFVNEYKTNLINFMRDVRDELHEPDLPFVIGEQGSQGRDLSFLGGEKNKIERFRLAQESVCNNNNINTDTNKKNQKKKKKNAPEVQANNNCIYVPTAQYAVHNGMQWDKMFHYHGRADTMFHIGKALGDGMIQLLQRQQQQKQSQQQQEQSQQEQQVASAAASSSNNNDVTLSARNLRGVIKK